MCPDLPHYYSWIWSSWDSGLWGAHEKLPGKPESPQYAENLAVMQWGSAAHYVTVTSLLSCNKAISNWMFCNSDQAFQITYFCPTLLVYWLIDWQSLKEPRMASKLPRSWQRSWTPYPPASTSHRPFTTTSSFPLLLPEMGDAFFPSS